MSLAEYFGFFSVTFSLHLLSHVHQITPTRSSSPAGREVGVRGLNAEIILFTVLSLPQNTTSRIAASFETVRAQLWLRRAHYERKILRYREGSFLINTLGYSLFLQDFLSKI
jgi:hypothetical protein